jgi:hypothetical protein
VCFFSPNTNALTPGKNLDLYLCANRTCEVGMEHATHAPYESFLYALEELSRLEGWLRERATRLRERLVAGSPALSFLLRRWTRNRLAEQVNSREIDDFIASSIENGLHHEKAKALGLLVGDRWRHRKLLT